LLNASTRSLVYLIRSAAASTSGVKVWRLSGEIRYRACRFRVLRSPQTPWCPLSIMARPPTQYAVQGVRLSPGGPSSQPL